MTEMQQYVEDVLAIIQRRDPEQTEFQNAAREVLTSLVPMLEKEPKYKQHHILERIIEPERVIIFRVPWEDDNGVFHVNRGYRVQANSAIGPSYNKHVPNIYFILVLGYACYRRCCGLVAAPYR